MTSIRRIYEQRQPGCFVVVVDAKDGIAHRVM